jgi:signal transduction histidine kinase
MSSELERQLLEAGLTVPVFVVRAGTIVGENAAAVATFGRCAGCAITSIFDPGSRAKLEDALARAPTTTELQTGAAKPVATSVTVLHAAADEQILVLARSGAAYSESMAAQLLAANDRLANLTRELARQAAGLEDARRRLQALAEDREHLISMLAHDVRGALQSIGLTAQHLAAGLDPAVARIAGLASMRLVVARISALVDAILDEARAESGRAGIKRSSFALREAVREAIEVYAPLVDRAGVRVVVADRLRVDTIHADRTRLEQVIANVLENAIRYSPRGGEITVSLADTVEGGARRVRIAMRDQGPGVPPELIARAFERFTSGSDRPGSLGIGLYVAHKIVARHGGRLWVENVEPHGSEFVIELPADGAPPAV